MRRITTTLIIISFLAACTSNEKTAKKELGPQDEAFDAFKDDFVNQLWENNPVWASYMGMHDYDNQLSIPNPDKRKADAAFWKNIKAGLDTFDLGRLNAANQIDHQMMMDQMASSKFYNETFKSYSWNPASYNLGGAFFQVLNYKEMGLEERMVFIREKMEHVQEYYEAARVNLKTSTEVHANLAMQQIKGSKSIFGQTLTDSLEKCNMDEAFKSDFKANQEIVLSIIDEFIDYLESELIPSLGGEYMDFRIGEEMFEQKFKHDINSDFTAKEIYQFALKEKSILHEKMSKVAEKLWSKYFEDETPPSDQMELIRKVITEVSKIHTHRDSFVVSIKKQIPELEAFVQNNGLITLDPEKPLVVRETPEYMRGFAGASISAPGPYDANAETYYNVTPLDHYSAKEAESYLREYNKYTLQILNIHEAVPGHYTQLVYSNQSPSIIKSIFSNGAMIEGWAVYTELMMLENGYSKGQAELDLMYYKWNLRTVCNTILDYGVHVLNMSEENAMDLMMNQAFQERSEAEGKWRRARLSQVQLCSYFTGYYEIRALREEMKEKLGDQFDLKRFHEEFLSYGSAPVKYIRQLMLENIQ